MENAVINALKKAEEELSSLLKRKEEELKKLRRQCWWDSDPCPCSSGPNGLKNFLALCAGCSRVQPQELFSVFSSIYPRPIYSEEEKDGEVIEEKKRAGERLIDQLVDEFAYKTNPRQALDIIRKVVHDILGRIDD